MSINKAIEEAHKFIELAQEYKQDFYGRKSKGCGGQFNMKSRAKMKRQSMALSEALVDVRSNSAYSDEA